MNLRQMEEVTVNSNKLGVGLEEGCLWWWHRYTTLTEWFIFYLNFLTLMINVR